ncbi:hypothetical protein [Dyadobacter sp. NIV53]|uniref:hypothetical protein n=1 Tax=Dyadobacter sp. NIV53 TaxID=2861765 RepID=UPI001C88A03E|nr:hypothetical protein [Dyadobacter sp. NIV53]
MKKLIVSAMALTLISFASVQANTPLNTNKEILSLVSNTQEKVAVKPEELPDGIKKTIRGEEFTGWKVTSAFLITAPDKTQYYELNVKNGKESARVKLDKDGKNVS